MNSTVSNAANAMLMREHGAPDVLTYAEMPLAPDKVRIRSIASVVNPSYDDRA
jgi:hypothetical protein